MGNQEEATMLNSLELYSQVGYSNWLIVEEGWNLGESCLAPLLYSHTHRLEFLSRMEMALLQFRMLKYMGFDGIFKG